jgi:hypothetical protein
LHLASSHHPVVNGEDTADFNGQSTKVVNDKLKESHDGNAYAKMMGAEVPPHLATTEIKVGLHGSGQLTSPAQANVLQYRKLQGWMEARACASGLTLVC